MGYKRKRNKVRYKTTKYHKNNVSQWATKRWLIIGCVSLTCQLFQGRRNGMSEASPEQRETIYLVLFCPSLFIGKCPLMTELLIYTIWCLLWQPDSMSSVVWYCLNLKMVRCHRQEEEGQGNLKNPTMLITQCSKYLSSVLNSWTDFNIYLCFIFPVWFNRYITWG